VAFNIHFEIVGVESILKWADTLPKMTQRQALTVFGRWGRQMVRLGRQLSPKDKLRGVDPRRRPEKESFALQWDYDTKAIGATGAELDVGNLDPRMRFIIFDTKPRAIPRSVNEQLAKGYPMRFVWRGGWHKAWMISGGVAAHGTKGQPVHEWVLEEFNIGRHLQDIAGGIR